MKSIFQTIMLLLGISVNIFAQSGPAQTIPQFTFFKTDKAPFTDKDLAQDKKIFFIFYDSDCEHCRHAIQFINSHIEAFSKATVCILTVDSKEKIEPFMDKYGIQLLGKKNVTILQDLNNEFIIKFKPRKYPSLFLYSANKQLMMYDDDEKKLPKFLKLLKK